MWFISTHCKIRERIEKPIKNFIGNTIENMQGGQKPLNPKKSSNPHPPKNYGIERNI
jgi:hypothetical protein